VNERHINDEHIQNYLDEQLSLPEVNELRAHLLECPLCRQQVLFYQRFYQRMAEADEKVFSIKFEKRVMHAIQGEPLGFLHKQLWQVFGGALGVVAFFKLSSLFMDYKPMLNTFRKVSFPSYTISWPRFEFWSGLQTVAKALPVKPSFLMSMAAVLVFMLILDQVITHIRNRLLSIHK
jgi:hypothetical protein